MSEHHYHNHSGEAASAEAVALELLKLVMVAEKRGTNDALIEQGRETRTDRQYLLDLMAECVIAVREPESRINEANRLEGLAEALKRGRERVAQHRAQS
ncbi:MAG: hypothetical protein AB7O04_01700 [Hyphomonadaceae bacterium]